MDGDLKLLNAKLVELISRGLEDRDLDGLDYAMGAGWSQELARLLTVEPVKIPGPLLLELVRSLGIAEQFQHTIAGFSRSDF